MKKAIIFDFSDTLVKMRPPKLLARRSLLQKLANKYQLAIITGARRAEVANILRRFNLSELFSLVISKNDSQYEKPDKKLFFLAKKILGFETAFYIGDIFKDFKFAENSKVPFYYVGKRKLGVKQDKDINKLLEYILCKKGR